MKKYSLLLIIIIQLFVLILLRSCLKEDIVVNTTKKVLVLDSIALRKKAIIEKDFLLKVKEMQCPGAALYIVYKGQKLLQITNGLRNRDSLHQSIDSATLFRIGSLSKGFAGLLAAKLVSQGKIDLNAPVSKYIPTFELKAKQKNDSIRVWHIISHSTGLTEHAFSNLIDNEKEKAVLLESLNRINVRDSTGKKYAYQNAAFSLIEDIIESTSGMSYGQALDHYIFKPLKMKNTSSNYDALMAYQNKAFPHRWNGPANGYVPMDFHKAYYNTPAAGGINSTLEDMSLWLQALIQPHHPVINDTIKRIAFARRIDTSWDDKYFNGWEMADSSHYCMGWRRISLYNQDIIFHGGQVNNFRCEFAFNAEQQYGVVALFNSHCDVANIITPMVVSILAE
jgi:beta-lactamase class C